MQSCRMMAFGPMPTHVCRRCTVGPGWAVGCAIQVCVSVVFAQQNRLMTHFSGCVSVVKWHVTAPRCGRVGHVIALCFVS